MQMKFSIKPYHSGSWLCLTVALICIFSSVNHSVAEDLQGKAFYQDTKHGWFWYEDPPLKQEKEEKRVKPPRSLPSLDNYSIDDLWNMYPDDFQELLNVLQKKAVQAPSEKNIMEYLTMQDVARRKALAYTNATMYVTQKYGELFNVNHVYPTTGPGITARVKMQQNEIFRTINRARNDYALIFFVSPGCSFCEKQAGILAYFVEKYGWQIKVVDISQNINAGVRFNVTITPTLLLIKKGQENYMSVSTGVIALTELERKLYRAIRSLQGNTQEDNFLMYDFQKGSPFDPTSILNKGKQPWKESR